jgi:hypothetical protein
MSESDGETIHTLSPWPSYRGAREGGRGEGAVWANPDEDWGGQSGMGGSDEMAMDVVDSELDSSYAGSSLMSPQTAPLSARRGFSGSRG